MSATWVSTSDTQFCGILRIFDFVGWLCLLRMLWNVALHSLGALGLWANTSECLFSIIRMQFSCSAFNSLLMSQWVLCVSTRNSHVSPRKIFPFFQSNVVFSNWFRKSRPNIMRSLSRSSLVAWSHTLYSFSVSHANLISHSVLRPTFWAPPIPDTDLTWSASFDCYDWDFSSTVH